jgi:hypothetical protein
MDKLIELLNEYDDNNWEVTDYWALFNRMNEWISETEDLQVISKKFWFIWWLVQNDKIDTTNKFTLMANVENKENWLWYAHTFEWYEALIMILSIQDNPIEFLVSILK